MYPPLKHFCKCFANVVRWLHVNCFFAARKDKAFTFYTEHRSDEYNKTYTRTRWPLSGCGRGHVTKFVILHPLIIFAARKIQHVNITLSLGLRSGTKFIRIMALTGRGQGHVTKFVMKACCQKTIPSKFYIELTREEYNKIYTQYGP